MSKYEVAFRVTAACWHQVEITSSMIGSAEGLLHKAAGMVCVDCEKNGDPEENALMIEGALAEYEEDEE